MSLSLGLLAMLLVPFALVGLFVAVVVSSVILDYVIFIGEDDFD
jgi:hypothetical protein